MSNQIHEYGLNVHLIGFNIQPGIMKGNEITVNVSTYPKKYKSKFSFPINESKQVNHVFELNVQIPSEHANNLITGQTEYILFSIKAKEMLKGQRKIAIARILPQDLPKISDEKLMNNTVIYDNVKKIKLYKTTKDQKKEFYKDKKNGFLDKYEISANNTIKRKEIGEMEVQLSLCEPFYDLEPIISKENDYKKDDYKKISYSEKVDYHNEEYSNSTKNKKIFKPKNNKQYGKF